MITADTITEAQIRDLREACFRGDVPWPDFGFYTAIAAQDPCKDGRVPNARARCAEILNTRAAKAMS